MTIAARPTLHDLVSAAGAGVEKRASITAEALRQAAVNSGEEVKTASASREFVEDGVIHVPTEDVLKLAAAVDYLASEFQKESDEHTTGPGNGPGALDVLEVKATETNIDAGELGTATSKHLAPKSPSTQAEKVQSGKANTGLETNDDMQHAEQPTDPMGNQKTTNAPQSGTEDAAFATPMKTSAALASNMERLGLNQEKVGFAITPEGHKYDAGKARLKARHSAEIMEHSQGYAGPRLGLSDKAKKHIGKPSSLVALARFGDIEGGGDPLGDSRHQEYVAKKHEAGGNAWNPLGGMLTPASSEVGGSKMLYGAYNTKKGKKGAKAKEKSASASLLGANLARMGFGKIAEDALNPASVSSGTQTPPEASASEEGVPSKPSNAEAQAKLVGSNQGAIDYTKRQAKADPIKDVNKVLTEPAMSAATDKTLATVLTHTDEAGAKISSVRDAAIKTAASRALLSKLLEKHAEGKKTRVGVKEKDSMGGAAPPPTPQMPQVL